MTDISDLNDGLDVLDVDLNGVNESPLEVDGIPLSAKLFGFVSIAYGMAIATVFPVVYETLRETREKFVGLVPPGGGFGEYLSTIGNERLAPSIIPYLDKVTLSLCLLGVWLGYFFLMAKIKEASENEYGPGLVAFDLTQGMLLLFTAKSLANFADKPIPQTDTSWLGLVLVLLMFSLRLLVGYSSVRRTCGGAFDMGPQYTCRALTGLAPLTAFSVGAAYFGYRQNLEPLRGTNLDHVLVESCSVVSILLILSYIFLARQRVERTGVPSMIEDCWKWAWKVKKRRFTLAAVLLILCAAGMMFVDTSLLLRLGHWRPLIPWSTLTLVAIVVSYAAVWWDDRLVVLPLGSRRGHCKDVLQVLNLLSHYFDRVLAGDPHVGFYSNNKNGWDKALRVGRRKSRVSSQSESYARQMVEVDLASTNGAATLFSTESLDAAIDLGEDHPRDLPAMGVRTDWDLGRGPAKCVLVLCVKWEALVPNDERKRTDEVLEDIKRGLTRGLQAIAASSFVNAQR